MTKPSGSKNLASSLRDRLRNRARETGEDVPTLLQRYASERFLYRLGQSTQRSRYVLKGATLFALWGGSLYRATRDLDFTGYGPSDTAAVLAAFREIASVAVDDDGLRYDLDALVADPIREETEYGGLRLRFKAWLGETRIDLQIDVGFGNAIQPPAAEVDFPTLFGDPAPRIRAYPAEAVVAEKLHALVVLGERTTRLKDVYDLFVLASRFPFEGPRLEAAIRATFRQRRTAIDLATPTALAPRFYADGDRATQWRAYLDRNRLPGAPRDFDEAGERLRAFLGPLWTTLAAGEATVGTWNSEGRWEAR